MLGRLCFPFFDSRFAREDLQIDELAPRWLYAEPRPAIERLGRLGRVERWIPPRPFARCRVSEILSISAGSSESGNASSLQFKDIDIIAGQNGHTRLTVELAAATPHGTDLSACIERIVTAEVAIRHPERRGIYEMLGSSAAPLADLYARESARTVRSKAGYDPGWVSFGRPFLIVVDAWRQAIGVSATAVELDVANPAFEGRVSFLPWRSEDEGMALPVWYICCPRGGEIWRQIAAALEDLTADYEELFLCSVLCEKMDRADPESAQLGSILARNVKRLTGSLRRETRHGVNLRAALRLLSDYDQSILNPRDSSQFEISLAARVQAEVSAKVTSPLFVEKLSNRSIQMTVYTGNIINYGVMADNTITLTNTMMAQSAAPDALKDKVKELRAPLIEAAKSLPEDQAKTLLKDYESFAEMALREKPPTAVVEAQGHNLVSVVKNIAQFATPVAAIVAAVIKMIGG